MDIGQLRVGKGYLMVTVGQQGELKENLTELHIIVRTTGLIIFFVINFLLDLDTQQSPKSSCSAARTRLADQDHMIM